MSSINMEKKKMSSTAVIPEEMQVFHYSSADLKLTAQNRLEYQN